MCSSLRIVCLAADGYKCNKYFSNIRCGDEVTDDIELYLLEQYKLLKESGMMWEFHPDLTGNWEEDKYKYAQYSRAYWPELFNE